MKYFIARCILAAFFCGFTTFAAEAAGVRFVDASEVSPNDTTVKSFGYVSISGPIERAGVVGLAAALLRAEQNTKGRTHAGDPSIFVILNSTGGNVFAAMDMGRLLRNFAARVWVDRNGECSSACIFLLAGGVTRWGYDARIGLHRPYLPTSEFAELPYAEAQQQYNMLLDQISAYLSDMGVRQKLFERMVSIPSQTVEYIDASVAEDALLFGEDPAHSEWQRARSIEAIGERRVQSLDQFRDCYNSHVADGEENAKRACSVYLEDW